MSTVVITCTGDRQLAFQLCRHYRDRFEPKVEHKWLAIEGPSSYDLNLYRALARLPHLAPDVEKIVIMEDDDWYRPDWLAWVTGKLDEFAIVGESSAKTYSVSHPSWVIGPNTDYSSLCATGFRAELLPLFMECLDAYTARYLDCTFWKAALERGTPHHLEPCERVVGIKGMPGRRGLGCAHGWWLQNRDPELHKLFEWIGEDDARKYLSINRAWIGDSVR